METPIHRLNCRVYSTPKEQSEAVLQSTLTCPACDLACLRELINMEVLVMDMEVSVIDIEVLVIDIKVLVIF